ncbi:MAG TPA: hypothetical protein VNA24_23575 [Hyalangium sp.]|nr:hypothetical protein [Hyalangium sp.]
MPESIATRLLTAPVLVLAVLLYPSELGDGTLHQSWRNTLNPVTRNPWGSQQEYEEFWRLPLHERERRIQESRESMRAPGGAGAEPIPQGMPSKDEQLVDPLGPSKTLVVPGSSENKPSLAPGARARVLRVATGEEFRELVEKTIIENFRDQQGFETVDAWTVVSISKPQAMSSDSPDPALGPGQERYYVEIHDSFTRRNYTVSVNWDSDLERFGVIKLSSGKSAKKNR